MKQSPVNRFWGLIKCEKEAIKKIYFYAILNGLVALSLPLGIQAIISFIQLGQITTSWIVLVVIVIGGILLSGWLQILQLKVSERIQERIFSKSTLELAFRIPKIKSESLYKFYPPELANRFFDTLTIQKGLSKILIDFTAALMQIIFGLILLSLYHPFFIFLGILITIMLAIVLLATFNQGLKTSIVESEYKYQTAHWIEEIARSFDTFKILGNNIFHLKKADHLNNQYLEHRKKHFSILLKQYWSLVGFKTILALSLLLIGGFLVINQNMNIGQFVAAEIVILLILASVEKFILSIETIYDVLTAFDKLGKIMDLELENGTDTHDLKMKEVNAFSVEFIDVCFNYPNTSANIIDNISFSINAGDKICLSGANASGKASLLNVMSTLFNTTSGIIKFNNMNISDLNLSSLRTAIGNFMEHETLFEGTILENICVGQQNIDVDYMNLVINKLQLESYINNQENGFNTKIMTEGKTLPNSIVQKILLARSIVSKPKLLIIGSRLSSINPKEKQEIIKFLTSDFVSTTLIIASNDPIVAEKCDEVIFIEKGKLLYKNTFNSIIKNNKVKGVYYA